MNEQQFRYYLLNPNQVVSNTGMLETLKDIKISGEKFTSDKEFRFSSNYYIRFENCTFMKLHVAHTMNLEFVDCKFNNLTGNAGLINLSNVTADAVSMREKVRVLITACNNTINSLTISILDEGYLNIKESKIPTFNLVGNTRNSKVDVENTQFGKLKFLQCKVDSTARLFFDEVTVHRELTFEDSILNYTEFQSCNFKNAVHIISDTQFDNASFININWFRRIYSKKHWRNANRRDKFEKNGNKQRYPVREFYEKYREYKLIMSRLQNRPDEIYFKSKEYNARFAQLSLFSRDFSDKLILGLNKYSNNHGRFWMVPIIWIFLIGAFFFYGFISNSSIACTEGAGFQLFSNHLAQYLIFLNPTHDLYYLDGHRTIYLQNSAVAFDWFFRIINAYLIFQTISSFRRYKE